MAEAKNRLPELIDRALKGEGVAITRHGRPVKVKGKTKNAGDFVSAMRDEENR